MVGLAVIGALLIATGRNEECPPAMRGHQAPACRKPVP